MQNRWECEALNLFPARTFTQPHSFHETMNHRTQQKLSKLKRWLNRDAHLRMVSICIQLHTFRSNRIHSH